MKKLGIFIILILASAVIFSCGQKVGNVVQVEGGSVSGVRNEETAILSFKGIPFAAPPVGELRWKSPQPVVPWEGVKKCEAFGPSPMQSSPAPFMFWSSEFLIPKEPISEDCLYLNVWTKAQKVNEKLPVLVYIYGGGFRSGGAGCPIYDGENIAKKGVVFVSINYRVGVFGFFAHPELTAESGHNASGNYAIMDMIAALQWVKNNIAAFGGDPGNVTIAGQSAGSFGVNFLTISPLAKGLFHKAIAQSGAGFLSSPLRSNMDLKVAENNGVEFATKLGASSIMDLRAKSSEEIQKTEGGMSGPFNDGYVILESVMDAYLNGRQNDVPVIVGWNRDDKVMFRAAPAEEFREQIESRFGDLSDEFFAAYPASTEEEAAQSQFDLGRDEVFGTQMYTWAKVQTKVSKSPVYIYNFNRAVPASTPETQFGAFHSGEIVYAYNNLHTLNRPWEAVDQKIADAMSDYWVNFARNGNPNGTGLPEWNAYDPTNENVMILDTEIGQKTLPDKAKLSFWETYYESLKQ